jgi:hypothetical protein
MERSPSLGVMNLLVIKKKKRMMKRCLNVGPVED